MFESSSSAKRLTYLFDTYLPDDYDRIMIDNNDNTFDTLLLSGHYPVWCVRSMLTTPFHFVGYSRTWYPKDMEDLTAADDGDADTIMSAVVNSNDVSSYTFVDMESGRKWTFPSYAQFYNHYQKCKLSDQSNKEPSCSF